jgi:3(or 17)beta-hydroxysteroid dehydrogenase
MPRLAGKVALITGGLGAIGSETVRVFVREGAAVVATDAKPAMDAGADAGVLAHDVTRDDQWRRIMDLILGRHGRLDILVNNAGVLGTVPENPENATVDEWHRVSSVNVDGVVLGCKHAIATMRASGGAIVNLSSVAGILATPTLFAYGGSKAAVRQLTKSVAVYCGRQGYPIRCNSVHPGIVESPMGRQVFDWSGMDPGEAQRQRLAMLPLKRFATPADVAHAILYLASDESSYVTGAEILVDGGMTIV